jgi:hypothetical protein
MCSPHLATGMWDRFCAAIRLLLLGSAGGGRLSVAESSLGNSRSGSCLAFVTRTMKLLRRSSAEFVCGEGVLLMTSVVATAVVLPEVAALTNTRLTPGCPPWRQRDQWWPLHMRWRRRVRHPLCSLHRRAGVH